jgi:hypothetical protein
MNIPTTILLIILIFFILIFYNKKIVDDNETEEIYKFINLKLKECQTSLNNKKKQYQKYKNLIDDHLNGKNKT